MYFRFIKIVPNKIEGWITARNLFVVISSKHLVMRAEYLTALKWLET